MAVTIKLTDNTLKVIEKLGSAKTKALAEIGLAVEEDAAKGSPVRTGALRDSWITKVAIGKGDYVQIGVPTNALKGNYAKYVELGTSRQPARHMLQNAVNANREQFPEIVKVEMKNA